MILKIIHPFLKIKHLVDIKGLRGTLYRLKATQIPKIARLLKKLKKEPVLLPH